MGLKCRESPSWSGIITPDTKIERLPKIDLMTAGDQKREWEIDEVCAWRCRIEKLKSNNSVVALLPLCAFGPGEERESITSLFYYFVLSFMSCRALTHNFEISGRSGPTNGLWPKTRETTIVLTSVRKSEESFGPGLSPEGKPFAHTQKVPN